MKTPCGKNIEHSHHGYQLPDHQIKFCNGKLGDTVPLGEDTTTHCMSHWMRHDDGRACAYHNRLGKWATPDKNGHYNLECLRSHS